MEQITYLKDIVDQYPYLLEMFGNYVEFEHLFIIDTSVFDYDLWSGGGLICPVYAYTDSLVSPIDADQIRAIKEIIRCPFFEASGDSLNPDDIDFNTGTFIVPASTYPCIECALTEGDIRCAAIFDDRVISPTYFINNNK